MNSNFSDEQIKAYAEALEEGDAIWCDGKWWELSKLAKNSRELTCGSPNRYLIRCFDGKLAISGFKEGEHPYRITTLEDYELQGGEKLVWLGESNKGAREFGKIYKTFVNEGGKVAFRFDDGSTAYQVVYNEWGIIPHYEQVKYSDDQAKWKPKFKVGDKVTVADKFTGVIEIVGNEPYVYGVWVEGEDGKKRLNNYWESDLGLYEVEKVGGRPASSHYHNNNGNDVWQFADDNLSDERVKGFHQINAIKYVSRYHKKHDTTEKRIEDLEKAKVSIDKLIELEKKG